MAWFVDGQESLLNLDGGEMMTWYYDGKMISQPIQWVDDLEHFDLSTYWYIYDEGQSNLPAIQSNGYEGTPRIHFPGPGNPNHIYTAENTPGNQSQQVENYFDPGTAMEYRLRLRTWSSSSLLRFYTGGNGTAHSGNGHVAIPLDGTDYWRLQYNASSNDYYGSITNGAPEDGSFSLSTGNWYRVVISKLNWPNMDAYIWDSSGNLLTELHSEDASGDPNNAGLGWWWNDETDVDVSYLNLIDSDDI